jgi:hypothetical protein
MSMSAPLKKRHEVVDVIEESGGPSCSTSLWLLGCNIVEERKEL